MQNVFQDIKYGLRVLLRHPGFAATAILTMALGVGANTTIFSLVNTVLLRPLPFAGSDRLVAVKSINMTHAGNEEASSPADFYDWHSQARLFEQIAVETRGGGTLTGLDRPYGLPGTRVSEDFFTLLRVNPLLGRTFDPSEFSRSSPPVMIISYGLWQQISGGDPNIIGKPLELERTPITVVGVMPAEFKEPSYAQIWTPLYRDSGEEKGRSSRYMSVIGRLKPGVTIAQAQAEMTSITGGLEKQYQDSNKNWSARVVSLKDDRVHTARLALLVLLGAVVFVLLIACANVISLLLSRATARYKEIAVRSALGASRNRIIQQLLTESILLSVIGGGLGLLIAFWGIRAIPALLPEQIALPRTDELGIDSIVLLFTLVVSVATGIVFGLVPAFIISRQNLAETLKQDGRSTGGGGRNRIRNLLVVAEIALALVLLVGGGLLLRSFQNLLTADLGFDAHHLTNISITINTRKNTITSQWAEEYRQMLEKLSAVPGVQYATLNTSPPLAGFNMGFPFSINGDSGRSNDQPFAYFSQIAPNYFRALSIPIKRGREFDDHDSADKPGVAIINEALARNYFADQDPIGKQLKIDFGGQPISVDIVGMVGDTKQMSVAEDARAEIYIPYVQVPWFYGMLIVKTVGEPATMTKQIREAIWSVDKDQSTGYLKTTDELAAQSVAQPRFYALLLALFAAIALVLAMVGIYGVMSYSVGQRTQEIGIRMALGAQGRDVLKMIIRQGMTLTLLGVASGLVASLVFGRVMSTLLYKVSPADGITLIGISVFLALTALAACYIPARRATKVDQMTALRYQ